MEETVACIANLYHNPNAEEKSQANQWLQILQNSVFAWKVRNIRDSLCEKGFRLCEKKSDSCAAVWYAGKSIVKDAVVI